MRHLTALGIKFFLTGLILSLILPFTATLDGSDLFWLTALVASISYVTGDVVLVPSLGSTLAAGADVLVVAGTLFLSQFIVPTFVIGATGAFVAGLALGIGEFFFHQFFRSWVLGLGRNRI